MNCFAQELSGGSIASEAFLCSCCFNCEAALPRSVFVPYFRYLVGPAAEQLQAASAATEPRKKKRKKDRDSAAATVSSTAEAALSWRLRLQVR